MPVSPRAAIQKPEGAHAPSLLYPFQWQVLKSRCGLHFRPVQRATSERRPRNVSQARYDQQQFKNTSPPGGTGMNDTPLTTVQQRKKLKRPAEAIGGLLIGMTAISLI